MKEDADKKKLKNSKKLGERPFYNKKSICLDYSFEICIKIKHLQANFIKLDWMKIKSVHPVN